MPGIVPDEGSKGAKLVLIGEAPGEWEDRYCRPFVGPSGQRWESWLGRFGLARSDFYIANVWQQRPHLNRIETVNREALLEAVDDLHERLAALTDPWLIVPTGNTALRALMGRALWGKDSPKITDWRGSILGYEDRKGRVVKVIPTLHPAFTLREPGAERACLHDWKRVAKDSRFRELRLPHREHHIEPTIIDLEDFVALVLESSAMSPTDWMAFDIETTQRQGNQVTCIGFALSPGQSFVVPTTPAYWAGKAELEHVWDLVRRLLHGPNPKVTQNGHYDYYWLGRQHGIRPVRWHWDTLAMHHCLDCTDSHSLGYLASCYTRQPYWKTMTKDSEAEWGVAAYGSDERTLWTYNGLDCCVTLELARKFHRMLEKRGQLDFYVKHYRELARPALKMMLHGVRVDDVARRWWHFNLQAERIECQDKLAELAGGPLHAAKSLSSIKVKKFLYEDLGLPKQWAKGQRGMPMIGKRTTSDEVAIRKLVQWTHKGGAKYDRARAALSLILEERRKDKLVSFLAPKVVDEDGRLRATFKLTTEAGRFASAKNPMRTGLNLQNQDREIRRTFVPDE